MAKTNAINALMHVTKQRHTAVKPLAKQEVTSVLPYQKTARPAIVVRVRRIALLITAKQSAHQAGQVSQQPQPPQRLAAKLVTNAHTSAPAVGIPAHVRQEKHVQMKSAYRTTVGNATSMHNAQAIIHTPTKVHARVAAIPVRKAPVARVVGNEQEMENAPRVTIHPYNLRAIAALAERMVGKLKPADNPAERLAANA